MLTWKQAVARVAKAASDNSMAMSVAAEAALAELSDNERAVALFNALLREAKMAARSVVRVAELDASRTSAGRARPSLPEVSNELKKRLGPVLEGWRQELRLTWTAELLASEFALRNGHCVTWGAASVEQHLERARIFMDNAAANTDAAARHTLAIRAIEGAGASCLNEVVEAAA